MANLARIQRDLEKTADHISDLHINQAPENSEEKVINLETERTKREVQNVARKISTDLPAEIIPLQIGTDIQAALEKTDSRNKMKEIISTTAKNIKKAESLVGGNAANIDVEDLSAKQAAGTFETSDQSITLDFNTIASADPESTSYTWSHESFHQQSYKKAIANNEAGYLVDNPDMIDVVEDATETLNSQVFGKRKSYLNLVGTTSKVAARASKQEGKTITASDVVKKYENGEYKKLNEWTLGNTGNLPEPDFPEAANDNEEFI